MSRNGNCARTVRLTICLLLTGALGVFAADAALDVPHVRQHENGCGAAALAMVMHYWSGYYPLPAEMTPAPAEVYRELYREEILGVRLIDMQRFAADRRFHAFALKGAFEDLEAQLEKGRPVIVGLSKRPGANRHFAVVAGVSDRRVWLNDPARKDQTKMKLSKFKERWSAADRWLLLVAPKDVAGASSRLRPTGSVLRSSFSAQ